MHQVFISYAPEDEDAASRVCEMLEADGTRCWLASRDAAAGQDAVAEALEAIRGSDLVLLIFSTSANASPSVLHEIERAAAYGRPLLPIRVDGATPNASLRHHLDLAPQLGAIASVETAEGDELGSAADPARGWRMGRRIWGIAAGAALVVAAVALGLGLALGLGSNRHHSTWTELKSLGTAPEGRVGHSMAYDPAIGRLLMFGGAWETEGSDDVWAFDPTTNTWAELNPMGGPQPLARALTVMIYDPTSAQLVMFGGLGPEDVALGDTWAFDPVASRWTKLEPAGALPRSRFGATMVRDSSTGRIIMFEGTTSELQSLGDVPLGEEQLDDTWAYDPAGNVWTNLSPVGARPAARGYQAMAYDPHSQRAIMFGGLSTTALFNDTWAYDPAANTWTELSPSGTVPSPRAAAAMAYDPDTGRLILFGGGTITARLNDAWAYDPTANTWTELDLSGTLPPGRVAHSLTYDPVSGRLIMFGGWDETNSTLDDMWALTP